MAKTRKAIPAFYIGMIMFSLGLFVATLLSTGMDRKETNQRQSSDTLFTLQDQNYAHQDLSYGAASSLHQLEQEYFEQKISLLERAALHLHLDKLAENRGVSRQTIRDELVLTAPITEEDVARFYDTNKEQITQPYFQIKGAIQEALQRDRVQQADQQLIDNLKRAGQLSIAIAPPIAPTVTINSAGYPARGPETAPVTVIDFTDYKCPHCKLAANTLTDVQQKFPDRIRVVTLELPILGRVSEYAAKAALCAYQQDQYWPLHQALFDHQEDLSTEKISELAKSLPIDAGEFKTCISDNEDFPLLTNAMNEARRLGLTGTPAIFINGMAYRGDNLEASLEKAIIDAVLASKN